MQPLQENILEKIKVNDHFKIQEEGNASSSEKQEEECIIFQTLYPLYIIKIILFN